MRVRLIYRKDLHTSEVGTIELDSPGPLVAVHTDGGMGTPLMDGSCVVYGLSYHCHEQRCKCGEGDKLSLVNQGADVKVSLVAPADRVRTIGESVASACTCCTCNTIGAMGRALDKEIMGAEAVGTVYDERANDPVQVDDKDAPTPVEPYQGAPPTPIQSKSVKKRLAAQSKGRTRTKAKR